ncbi:hypothetical protein ACJRO7_009893 [Eucalyptus globulus]|uniref:Uncharacterized protein n=1 Tax=Eucalyptus globulus TaxID=34317 RepID=A0ABD3LDR8_EUCGL
MRYAGVLYRIDPHDAIIGLANGAMSSVPSFVVSSWSPSFRFSCAVVVDRSALGRAQRCLAIAVELQVLSSESQPEKVTSDLPDDPAIIQAIFFHSSSASAITPPATIISRPNSSTGLPPGLAAYHIKQPMQYPETNPLTMSIATTYGLSDSLKPPFIMDSLTSTFLQIYHWDLLRSRITSISSAAKCSSTAGLNINPIPQVIHGATFVRGSGLVPESLPLAMFHMNESGSLNHMGDLKPLPMTPILMKIKEVVKCLTSGSLPRELTGAQVYKGNLQNHNSITSKSAKRGKRVLLSTLNYKAYEEGKGEKKPSELVFTNTKPWARENRAESRTNQNTSNSRKGGKKIGWADRQHHQTSKSISIPHLGAKYAEDFDILGNHSKTHSKTKANASDLPAVDAEVVDAAMKLGKKMSFPFWMGAWLFEGRLCDSLSTGPPGPWKPKISELWKLDMETFGYCQVHHKSHGSRMSRPGGNPNVSSERRENGYAG